MDHKQAVRTWADRWVSLRCWPQPLSSVRLALRKRSDGWHSTGTCYAALGRITITVGSDIPDALATVLHEYAHAALPLEGHGARWQTLFAQAVHEVTGRPMIQLANDYRVIDHAATDAMRAWWKLSGNEFAYNLLNKARKAT